MINARDLRLGNWISYCDKEGLVHIGSVISLSETGNIDIVEIGETYPIGEPSPSDVGVRPLVLERYWLLRLGFKAVPDTEEGFPGYAFSEGGVTLQVVPQRYTNGVEWFSLWAEFNVGMGFSNIWHIKKYVHEIQNFYFALTGKEILLR